MERGGGLQSIPTDVLQELLAYCSGGDFIRIRSLSRTFRHRVEQTPVYLRRAGIKVSRMNYPTELLQLFAKNLVGLDWHIGSLEDVLAVRLMVSGTSIISS